MGIREYLARRAKRKLRQELKLQEKLNLEIRDSLAMQRTKMANERTLLSYIRTAMAMVLAGLTFIKFFEDLFYIGIGIFSIPIGVGVAYFGYHRFTEKRKEILRNSRFYTPTSTILAEAVAQEKEGSKE